MRFTRTLLALTCLAFSAKAGAQASQVPEKKASPSPAQRR